MVLVEQANPIHACVVRDVYGLRDKFEVNVRIAFEKCHAFGAQFEDVARRDSRSSQLTSNWLISMWDVRHLCLVSTGSR